MSNGFDKSTSYSYGYVARANGTDYFDGTEGSKRVKRSTKGPEGELRLVEKVGDTQSAGLPDGNSRNGLTPKKFFLVGVNTKTNDVEVTGLVSLVKDAHKGLNVQCTGTTTKGKGPTTIQNGYCDDRVFFKKFEERDKQPGFIETQLKNSNNQQVGVLGFTKGLTLTATFGKRVINNGKNEERLSRSAPITVKDKEKDQNLYTGKKGGHNRPYVVLHDLKFSSGSLRDKWGNAENGTVNLMELGIPYTKTNSENIATKIPLSNERQYYIWDPSFTEIKDGQLRTKNGHALPWNNNVELLYTYQLTK